MPTQPELNPLLAKKSVCPKKTPLTNFRPFFEGAGLKHDKRFSSFAAFDKKNSQNPTDTPPVVSRRTMDAPIPPALAHQSPLAAAIHENVDSNTTSAMILHEEVRTAAGTIPTTSSPSQAVSLLPIAILSGVMLGYQIAETIQGRNNLLIILQKAAISYEVVHVPAFLGFTLKEALVYFSAALASSAFYLSPCLPDLMNSFSPSTETEETTMALPRPGL